MRSTPLNGFGTVGKICARNLAVCPEAGTLTVTGAGKPVVEPSRFVTSNVTLAAEVPLLATAIPLWMFPGCPSVPDDSTYVRNAVPLSVGTPASETTTPSGLYENTTSAVGTAPPAAGTMRTAPAVVLAAVPGVAIFCELRRGTEYVVVVPTVTGVPLSFVN